MNYIPVQSSNDAGFQVPAEQVYGLVDMPEEYRWLALQSIVKLLLSCIGFCEGCTMFGK